jgi:uncharacterized membrane protein
MKNFLKTIAPRFKSWALWLSIAALVTFCVKEFAGIDISDTVDGFMNVLLPVLVAFGIINNPTDRKGL